ncbi:hypothetical protein [Legionella maceachernii]|uniref:hypothetical protein n=1 Tax=Legionella maceachernii TaxID=466 RepID=UPI00099A48BA|nr:hypothetical protein [Legionella maceachernii]SJZ44957.1 hypothetical protein SAMN02745128_00043 [Legionella maceachernii]SUP04122.1 Uncharacterised protein [Legionella maceachernii]
MWGYCPERSEGFCWWVIAKSREVLRVAQDDGGVVVLSVVRDLPDGVTAKSWEALRVAQDDRGIVVPNVVRDLPDGVIAKSREVLRVAQDDSELCCRPERSEGSP